jgi:flagellar hook-associated protein 2
MVTSVTFGNINTSGGRTTVSGGQSGFDTEALIKGLTEARRLPAVALEKRQEQYAAQSSAFQEFKTLLTNFQSSADLLRRAPTVGSNDGNVFDYRVGSVRSNGGLTDGTAYVSATVTAGANLQNYTINEVSQLARAKKQQSTPFVVSSATDTVVTTSAGPGYFEAGTFTLKGQVITLEEGDSLETVVAKFNAVSADSGIRANILQTAPGEFSMIFTATATGLSANFDMSDPASVDDPDGVLANIGFSTVQNAQNAVFKIDSITIERESNNITDLIPGVTLTLKQETPVGLELDFSVEPDTEAVTQVVTTFLESYNELRLFLAKQTEITSSGSLAEDAVLGNNSALRSVINGLTTELSRAVGGLVDGNLNKLADIGVTFYDYEGDAETPRTRNLLTLDAAKLAGALEGKFDQVQRMFEFNTSSTIPDFQIFRRGNGLAVSEFSLNLDPANNVFKATYEVGGETVTIDLKATAITGGGWTLTAPDESALGGLQMIYAGSAAVSGTVSVTQGIGDRIYNALNEAVKQDGGLITNEIDALKTREERMKEEIARIDEVVERYREQLIDRFSKLESALASINTILQSLAAQADARNNA